MSEAFLNGKVVLHGGDCLDILPTLDAESIDAIVCDQPYGLSFMGRAWDHGVPSVAIWAECLRVLKPGGHLLAFAGTRTQHRMACAIEDAGFEVRDLIAWVYGSGFPKSHDVAKGIDRAGGLSPKAQAELLRNRRLAANLTREELAARVGCTVNSVRDWEEGRARAIGAAIEWIVPSANYRAALVEILGYSEDERSLVAQAVRRRGDGTVFGLGHTGDLLAGGNTPASLKWQGWGTALKPALEPITVARKPLAGTVAETVLSHGTGALNIKGCRVDAGGGRPNRERRHDESLDAARNTYGSGLNGSRAVGETEAGRWPANLIHDGSDEVVEAFPERIVNTPAGPSTHTGTFDGGWKPTQAVARENEGSAARFFYAAKADSDDRIGSRHPTVKPLDLMQYLVRLVTPPGGLVLDPFAGTGTTGEAAIREGMRAILIEMEAESQADIARRMALLSAGPAERSLALARASIRPRPASAHIFADPLPTAAE